MAASVVHVGNRGIRHSDRWETGIRKKREMTTLRSGAFSVKELWVPLSSSGMLTERWLQEKPLNPESMTHPSCDAFEDVECNTGVHRRYLRRVPSLEPARTSLSLGWLRWSSQLLSPTARSPTQPTHNWEAWLPCHGRHVCN